MFLSLPVCLQGGHSGTLHLGVGGEVELSFCWLFPIFDPLLISFATWGVNSSTLLGCAWCAWATGRARTLLAQSLLPVRALGGGGYGGVLMFLL